MISFMNVADRPTQESNSRRIGMLNVCYLVQTVCLQLCEYSYSSILVLKLVQSEYSIFNDSVKRMKRRLNRNTHMILFCLSVCVKLWRKIRNFICT